LYCNNNPLKSFPNFPNNLEYLYISINQVLLLNIENISSEIRRISIFDETEYINYAVDEPTKIIEKIDALKSKFGDKVSFTIPKFNKFKQEFKIELEKITEEMSQHKLYPKQSTTFPKEVSKEIMSYVAKGGKRKTVKKLNIYL
jgi:alanyl-tRNA synthetase